MDPFFVWKSHTVVVYEVRVTMVSKIVGNWMSLGHS